MYIEIILYYINDNEKELKKIQNSKISQTTTNNKPQITNNNKPQTTNI
jgi:hypothetical protein